MARKCPRRCGKRTPEFYDPFRPNIEPDGFASEAELVRSRDAAISAFRRALVEADLFVFTLGLTESWFNKEHGYEYPMCPGTVAGDFDASRHEFTDRNLFVHPANTDRNTRSDKGAEPAYQVPADGISGSAHSDHVGNSCPRGYDGVQVSAPGGSGRPQTANWILWITSHLTKS